MSEFSSQRSDPETNAANNRVCPYLGWYVDSETHHAYPSVANHCHTQEPPLTIELAYQASTCLGGNWATCQRYKGGKTAGVAKRPAALPWLGAGQVRRPPGWAIAGLGLVAVLLIGGLFLLLGPLAGRSRSSQPTEAIAIAQRTSTVAVSPTSAEALEPTASPMPAVSATESEAATATATATSTPSPSPSPSPSATASPTASPTATATPSASPTATSQASPEATARASSAATLQGSPTPITTAGTALATSGSLLTSTATATVRATSTPSPEPTATSTPTATRAPTQTPRPTPRPTSPPATATSPPATATSPPPAPRPQFPAPGLVSPANGQVFSSRDTVVLNWQPVGSLAPDEYYVPTVAYQRYGETWYDETPWTKETTWALSDHRYLLDLSDNGEYRWAVRVMRRTGVNAEGRPEGTPRSPLSEVRALTWRRSGGDGGGGGGTPEPPPP